MATWLAVMSASTPALAEETTATLPAYAYQKPNRPLLYTGVALGVSTYVVTAALSAAGQRAADRDLFVPLAGPFMNLSNRNCARDCTTDTQDTVTIATSGALQLVAVGLIITSAFVPEKVSAGHFQAGPVKMLVTPTAAANGGGVGAVGTF